MGMFKKSVSINGKYKELTVVDGHFVEPETGEEINLAEQLESIYGNQVFSLTTSNKIDVDLD